MKQIYLFILLLSILIVGSAQELTPKQEKNKWGFVNAAGEWVVKAKYTEVKKFTEELACVRVNNKWGFINKEGKSVIPFQYSNALSFKNGFAGVRSYKPIVGTTREDNNQYKWGYITTSGLLVIPFQFKEVQGFDTEGRAKVQLFNMQTTEFFWINQEGKPLSPPFTKIDKEGEYFKIQNRRTDGAEVYRYLKKSGEPITEWYLNNFNLNDSLIIVWLPTSKEADTVEVEAFMGNAKKKLCAIISKEGKVLSSWFSEIKPFINGYAPVRHRHLYGFVDSTYKMVTTPKYRELSVLREGVYKGQVEYGKTVLMTTKGEEFSQFCFDFENFTGDLFLGQHQLESTTRNEIKYAVFDAKGNQKTSWYNKVHEVHNGVVRVEDVRIYSEPNENSYVTKYNYVNLEQERLLTSWRTATLLTWEEDKLKKDSILNYLYLDDQIIHLDHAFFSTLFVKEFNVSETSNSITFTGGDFHNGYALVAKKIGVVKENRNGLQLTKDNVLYGYIDWNGNLAIPYKFKEAAAFRDEHAVVGNGTVYGAINSKGASVLPLKYNMLAAYGSGLFPVLNNEGLWGYVNRQNRLQLKHQYSSVTPFSYGYASVKKGNYWGLIDVMGNEVMKMDYQKPIEVISPLKIKYLKSGVGYLEVLISDLPLEN